MARFALALFAVGALVVPSPSDGQLVGGVFGSRARDTFEGTNGIGAEAGVSLPMLPFDVFADGTLFFPSCAECDFKGWSLGVRLRIPPVPVVQPYLTGGRTWRKLEDPNEGVALDDAGIFAGAGLEISFPGTGAGMFAEGRYEFLTGDSNPNWDLEQWIFRAGLMMRWGGLPL